MINKLKNKIKNIDKSKVIYILGGLLVLSGLLNIYLLLNNSTGLYLGSCSLQYNSNKNIDDKNLNRIGDYVVNNINKYILKGVDKVNLVNVSYTPYYYIIYVKYRGKDIPVYLSLDKKLLFFDVINLENLKNQSTPKFEVNKTKVPNVKLFIMSFCPYGNIAEKAMHPVINLLNNTMNFVPYYIYDKQIYKGNISDLKSLNLYGTPANVTIISDPTYGKILIAYTKGKGSCKYIGKPYLVLEKNHILISSLHDFACINNLSNITYGAYPKETIEDLIEKSIYKLYGPIVWSNFVVNIDKQCALDNILTCWKKVAKELNLNVSKIINYYQEYKEKLAMEDIKYTTIYNVMGSPTLIINNETYNYERTPEAYKNAICNAYLNKPSACSKTLDSNTENYAAQGSCS